MSRLLKKVFPAALTSTLTPQKILAIFVKKWKVTKYFSEVFQFIHSISECHWCHWHRQFVGFSAKFYADNEEPIQFSLCLETAQTIFCQSLINSLINPKKLHIFLCKCAVLSQINWIFRVNAHLVAKYCCHNLLSFSANIFELKDWHRQFYRF